MEVGKTLPGQKAPPIGEAPPESAAEAAHSSIASTQRSAAPS